MPVLIRRYKGHNGMMQEERIDDDAPVPDGLADDRGQHIYGDPGGGGL